MCLFSPPKYNAPKAPMPEDANAAAYRDTLKRSKMAGFASTISPQSLLGAGTVTPSPAMPKTLLGG